MKKSPEEREKEAAEVGENVQAAPHPKPGEATKTTPSNPPKEGEG